jgi:hypothetical protein
VHRRYDKDYPPPQKEKGKPDLYAAGEEDEDEDDGEDEEGFALGDPRGDEDGADGYTRASWLAAVGELWEAGETAWRDEFLAAQSALRDVEVIAEVEAELDAGVAHEAALEVAALARDTERVRLSGEPSAERIGVAVLNAAEENRAVRAGEKAAEPVVFPEDELGASPAEHMTKASFDERLKAEEARLGKKVVAAVKRSHRYGRYRIDWAPILGELALLTPPAWAFRRSRTRRPIASTSPCATTGFTRLTKEPAKGTRMTRGPLRKRSRNRKRPRPARSRPRSRRRVARAWARSS